MSNKKNVNNKSNKESKSKKKKKKHNSNKGKKLGRRRTTYKEWLVPEKLELITGWARAGLSNEQIANNIGIHVGTLYDWQNKYNEFAEALKKGKEVVDYEVENALYKKALGYNVPVKKAMKLKKVYYRDGNRHEEEKIEYVTEEQHVVADTVAQIFWLKNRMSDKWRDKVDVHETGDYEITEIVNDIE